MMKKGKKKPKIVEYDSDIEFAEQSPATRTEIVYEDTKEITRSELEFKWGRSTPCWLK